MSADRIDVLSVMDRYGFTCGDPDSDCSKARAAVAELIAVAKIARDNYYNGEGDEQSVARAAKEILNRIGGEA